MQASEETPPGRIVDPAPIFDQPVLPGGYLWWYLDGLSDDGNFAVTVIALIGSVFSPYYAWMGRKTPANHVALNVCLYSLKGGGENRWSMTERGQKSLTVSRRKLRIGPSSMAWNGQRLSVSIDERGAPIPRRISGEIMLTPTTMNERLIQLDGQEQHFWRPIAPMAQIELDFDEPQVRWRGSAYWDMNVGLEPLEQGFRSWQWSRTSGPSGATVLYDTVRRDETLSKLALRFAPSGAMQRLSLPKPAALPDTRIWRIRRNTMTDQVDGAEAVKTLEDTPFYARTLLKAQLYGQERHAIHESLDLDRFSRTWVRALLPFRMPRKVF